MKTILSCFSSEVVSIRRRWVLVRSLWMQPPKSNLGEKVRT
jgi:hypothetical protein